MSQRTSTSVALMSALVLSSLLAGCTGYAIPDEHTPVVSPSAQASPIFPAQGLPEGATSAGDVPYDVANDSEARKLTNVTGCVQTDDGWAMTGTVSNVSSSDAAYEVTAFFSTPSATVLATGETRVVVAGQASADWRVGVAFDAPDDVRCVLRGVGAVG
ncbi:hypothetical protein ITJ44_15705 [Clavibacter sp. VKM Ac-2873]|uniref:hypothetical protein n=1 Tax=Clavibacter sp. VKM Ac-2873 TaxID=2783813 RepID=UPI00188D4BC2|nr:hypothetical protein [Clavibacter sp. VKM Ac-2873]MBF4619521.1 hypothetical protein [Clavibacter sp. VKM Ac-2873]